VHQVHARDFAFAHRRASHRRFVGGNAAGGVPGTVGFSTVFGSATTDGFCFNSSGLYSAMLNGLGVTLHPRRPRRLMAGARADKLQPASTITTQRESTTAKPASIACASDVSCCLLECEAMVSRSAKECFTPAARFFTVSSRRYRARYGVTAT